MRKSGFDLFHYYVSKKTLFVSFIVFAIVLYLVATSITGANPDFGVYLSFALNFVIVILLLFSSLKNRPFSMVSMHHLFFLIFMVLVPFMQMQFGAFKVWGTTLRNEERLTTNVAVMIWLIFVVVGHSIAGNHVFKVTVKNRSISEKKLALYTTIVVIITFISTLRKGPSGTFFYGGSLLSGNESSSINALIYHCQIAFFTFAFTLNTQMYQKGKGRFLYVLLTGICLIYCFFPTVLSRYSAAATYFCALFVITRNSNKSLSFFLIIFFGILILWPLADLYRYNTIAEVSAADIIHQLSRLKSYFYTGNYDAFNQVALSKRYVDRFGVSFGEQLLTVFLFWIPRKWWPGKSVGSGQIVANGLGLTWTNISMPIAGEGIINFGWLGVILFALIYGYLIQKLDNSYDNRKEGNGISFIEAFYGYIVPYNIFLCRGDMLSTVAYLVANIVVLSLMLI